MADTLTNAIFIGYMVGTKEVLGRSVQAVANMAGETVALEVLKFAEDKGYKIDSLEKLEKFILANKLANISLDVNTEEITATIDQCGICPKKIGGYVFEGTACPWGGILSGTISEILQEQQMASAKLVPGEICTITLRRSSK